MRTVAEMREWLSRFDGQAEFELGMFEGDPLLLVDDDRPGALPGDGSLQLDPDLVDRAIANETGEDPAPTPDPPPSAGETWTEHTGIEGWQRQS